ncbi:hypothetical protein DPMN_164317 [Dreissena polymorpha]|uniref:Uncharacterized protein n=1 Tax=Dreissena polymorpha TaxID=45954 RepID=A0A9D4EYH4_DREPO|nr:hypothetical protein DPMN_164317 [Dreissena polymorpha]
MRGSVYHDIADLDVNSSEYDAISDVTGSNLQSNKALSPIPGASSSMDGGYITPMTANRSRNVSLKTKDKPLRQTDDTWYITPVTRELSVDIHAALKTKDKSLRRASFPLYKTTGTVDLCMHKYSTL